jgi:hypothetical protein
MEEGSWAARVLSEIGAARAAIAASYQALWREATEASMDEQTEPPALGAGEGEPAPAPPTPSSRGSEGQ